MLPGAVFTKGLSQVLGLTFVQKYSHLKPETWLRPFVNTAPGNMFLAEDSIFQICGLTHFIYIHAYTEKYEVTELCGVS